MAAALQKNIKNATMNYCLLQIALRYVPNGRIPYQNSDASNGLVACDYLEQGCVYMRHSASMN